MLGIKRCAGCKERGDKMKAAATVVIDWMKNPTRGGAPPLDQLGKLSHESDKSKNEKDA